MLTKKELLLVDGHFIFLAKNKYCVTLRSKCTKHEWHIVVEKYPSYRSFNIYHRHHKTDHFHFHGRAGTFKKVLEQIKSHDEFQMNGRTKIRNRKAS